MQINLEHTFLIRKIMNKNNICKAVLAIIMLAVSIDSYAAEAVYRIVEYNKTTGEFTLAASGMVPKDSWAYFENDYGATTGNRYNQIPRNRKATLYLEGWQGCRIKSVTLSMCSNNKAGQAALSVNDGDTPVYTMRQALFNSDEWFGEWVSKDLNVYVDITKQLDTQPLAADECAITLQGGTAEGSVYLNSITIDYDEADGTALESALGWSYTKLTKKSTLNEGDQLMLYRNGCAAADIDGMETAHYLDAVALPSTTDVTDHDVLRFALGKGTAAGTWTLTDQQGRVLGATGKQALAWGEGATAWTIDLGYDGAEIASTNTACGTLRYNAPAGSYARFNVYTSTSLPLPYLYRRDKQHTPVVATALTFGDTDITASLDDGHIVLAPTLLPSATTDRRVAWSSSDATVATVNGGYVSLKGVGQTTITAATRDGGAQATVRLTVTEATAIDNATIGNGRTQAARKHADGRRVVIETADGYRYGTAGEAVAR